MQYMNTVTNNNTVKRLNKASSFIKLPKTQILILSIFTVFLLEWNSNRVLHDYGLCCNWRNSYTVIYSNYYFMLLTI